MKTAFEKIAYFNELIGNGKSMAANEQIDVQFAMIVEELDELREALEEYTEARDRCDKHGNDGADVYDAEQAFIACRDGIADVLVTVYGLAHRMGVNADADLEAVYESNMSKFIQGNAGDAELAAAEVTARLEIAVSVTKTAPGIWAITSSYDQTGADGKSYPKGKLLKPASFKEPKFD